MVNGGGGQKPLIIAAATWLNDFALDMVVDVEEVGDVAVDVDGGAAAADVAIFAVDELRAARVGVLHAHLSPGRVLMAGFLSFFSWYSCSRRFGLPRGRRRSSLKHTFVHQNR